jgi:hypothetical protein
MDRAYRDSRINRIFEGTNEINRLLSVDMLLKRAMKGQLDLMGPAQAVQAELMSVPDMGGDDSTLFAVEKKAVAGLKKAVLMTAGVAVQKYMMELSKEQEIIMNIADMAMEVFAMESVMLRTEKLVSIRGEASCQTQIDIMKVFINDAIERAHIAGKNAVNAMVEGDEQKMLLMGLKRCSKYQSVNTKDARRRVAKQLIDANKYCF